MPATEDRDLLLDAARAGGDIAMSHWRRDPQTWTKPDDSPVSAADLAVDAFLHETLCAARPAYGWLSEETEDTADRLGCEMCFIVDPIDGTRAYLSGQDTWALSLAVARAGRVVAAVIHLPAKGLTYAAADGAGATLNGAPLAVTRRAEAEGAHLITSKATYGAANWRTDVPAFARHYRPSMAYRLAVVAEGRFDAMMTLRKAWEWDIAAGVLIAAEAGARVTDRRGGELRFNTVPRQTDGVVIANPDLHGAILDRLA